MIIYYIIYFSLILLGLYLMGTGLKKVVKSYNWNLIYQLFFKKNKI